MRRFFRRWSFVRPVASVEYATRLSAALPHLGQKRESASAWFCAAALRWRSPVSAALASGLTIKKHASQRSSHCFDTT